MLHGILLLPWFLHQFTFFHVDPSSSVWAPAARTQWICNRFGHSSICWWIGQQKSAETPGPGQKSHAVEKTSTKHAEILGCGPKTLVILWGLLKRGPFRVTWNRGAKEPPQNHRVGYQYGAPPWSQKKLGDISDYTISPNYKHGRQRRIIEGRAEESMVFGVPALRKVPWLYVLAW